MTNLSKQTFDINLSDREILHGHKSLLIWFTGLPESGKSTLANLLEINLHKQGIKTYLLDGDNVRMGINSDLGFSEADRTENLRRVGEIAKLMIDAGLVTIAAFVSPFEKDRKMVNNIVGSTNYFEIFLSTPLDMCIQRDSKGLYRKALNGEIFDFTGISSPYELPKNAHLTIDTSILSTEEAIEKIFQHILPLLRHD